MARLAPDERRETVARVLEREHRLALAHAQAMAGRARAASRGLQVRQESPTGAFWRRDPDADSCERCRFMDGKLWPWEVLDRFSPPVHPNCRCQLIPVGAARYSGLVGPKVQMPSAKQGIARAARVLQETVAGAILVEAVRRGLFREADIARDWMGRFAPEHSAVGAPSTSSPVRTRDRGHDRPRLAGIGRHPALGTAMHTAHPTGPPKPPGYVSPARQWLDANAEDGFKADPVAMDFAEFLGNWRDQGVETRLRRGRVVAGEPVIEGTFERDGVTVGNFRYRFRSKQRRLAFDEIVLEGQGGVGTKFAREVINRARDDDRIDAVDLEAGYSAGGYVWAREGVQPISPFKDVQRDVLNQQFDRVVREMEAAGVPETKSFMRDLRKRMKKGGFESLQELAAYGRERPWVRDVKGRQVTMWPGKALLAGASYRASFNTRTVVTEMLDGMDLFDLSHAMGLSLPPDELDLDDRAFWDRVEDLSEDLWRESKHRRDSQGQFTKGGVSVGRYVPRTPEAIAAKRGEAYEKRWGEPLPVPPRVDVEQFDDPELLDALEDAQAHNEYLLGADVFEFYGEQPIVLVEKIGEGFYEAVADASGKYSAKQLRAPGINGAPSIMEGRGSPRPPTYEVIEKHPMSGQRVEYASDFGVASAADLASVIRHEWWHYIEQRFTMQQQGEYRSLFPRVPDKSGNRGPIDSERIAREVCSNAGYNQSEAAAEVFAITTHPDFKASEWPEWVGQAGLAMADLMYEVADGVR